MARSVLWVIKGLGPGGAERLLVEAAAALQGADLAITCAYVVPVKRHLVPEMEAAGVRCVCLSRSPRDPRWPARLARLVRTGGFDVVHVHSPLPGSVARLAVRTLPDARRPVVLTTEHNAWGTYRRFTRRLNRWTSRWDRHTFAVSPEAAQSITGAAATRVSVLTHGVHVDGVRAHLATRGQMRAELGLPADALLFGTVANFRHQKDYPNLLRACALLVERGVPVRVVAVGQGPLDAEIRALHAELGLADHVSLLGYRADAQAVLAACDVFVLASRYEGLPVALMEACALGLPAVLTDVGGMRAALGDAGAAWVRPESATALADAMAEVAASPERRAALAAAASAAAPTFDSRTAMATLRRWYLVAAPLPGAPPVPRDGITVRRAVPDDLPAILELARRSLGWDSGDWEGLYRWKHVENAFGTSPSWVAFAGDRLVGLRVFMRWQFEWKGHRISAVRAVDTATDPDFQGRGLFTAMTLGALPELRAEGVQMVFNTPNSQSRPGYLKMGWRDVGRLRPNLHVVRLRRLPAVLKSRVPADHFPLQLTIGRSVDEWLATDGAVLLGDQPSRAGLHTVIDLGFARWRYASPLQPCRVVGDGDVVAVIEVRRRGQVKELVRLASWGPVPAVDRLLVRTARKAGADVVLRLGKPSLVRRFLPVPGAGPDLTCLMLTDEPAPPLREWNVFMGDISLF